MLLNKNLGILLFSLLALAALSGSVHAAGITIGSGSTLDVSTATLVVPGDISNEGSVMQSTGVIQLNGNWTNHGVFQSTAGTVEITTPSPATTTQNVRGNTKFYNFRISGDYAAADRNITFEAGTTQTVEGRMTLKGDSIGAGYKLYMRSSSAGNQWHVNPTNTGSSSRDVSRVNVKDSVNDNSVTIDATYSTGGDAGNNVRWFFEGSPFDIGDNGWVRNTTLTRDAATGNLILSWTYDPAHSGISVSISVETTATTDSYAAKTTSYTWVVNEPNGVLSYIDTNKAYDGLNRFYRVVPNPLPSTPGTDILSAEANGLTVGKVQMDIPNNKYVFSNIPFMTDGASLKATLAEQVGSAGEFLWWDGAGYHPGTYAGSSWGGDDDALKISEGFLVRSHIDGKKLAITGRIGKFATPFVRHIPQNTYELVSFPYPMSQTMEVMGLTPD
ncbi:MAG TPA: hypothetical protein VMD02_01510, partial [Candidatus Omnitrophota bacterium]|nr:hypothetical protein [Candidatus Omnitrophota bacterium]